MVRGDEWYEGEQELLMEVFETYLWAATGDGRGKRESGEKPPWWRDPDHWPAFWSHMNKWAPKELEDEDSGAHPLVHAAWRLLAIAWQEKEGRRDPRGLWLHGPEEPEDSGS